MANTSLFLPGAGGAELRGYYSGSGTAVTVSAVVQLVAAAGLLWFGRGASAAVGGGRGAERATWLAAFGFAVSSGLSLVLLGIAGSAGDGTLVFVARLTLAFGGPVHLFGLAGLLWFVSRDARAGDRTPRWVWRFGTVVAPLMLLSVVSIADVRPKPAPPPSPAGNSPRVDCFWCPSRFSARAHLRRSACTPRSGTSGWAWSAA